MRSSARLMSPVAFLEFLFEQRPLLFLAELRLRCCITLSRKRLRLPGIGAFRSLAAVFGQSTIGAFRKFSFHTTFVAQKTDFVTI